MLSEPLETVASQSCPSCGTRIPAQREYVTWCHECGWNVTVPQQERSLSFVGRMSSASGRRTGRRLVDELAERETIRPRLTAARLGAYVVAVLVAVLTVAFFGLGVVFFLGARTTLFTIPFGVVFCAIAVLMRPRLGKVPSDGALERQEAPMLYALLDDVAAALETRRVDVVIVDEAWNASWAVLGLRRRRVVTLGLPLLAALGPQERVAVIAHELAHARNGDSQRGLVVGSALRGLAEFYDVVAPDSGHGAFDVPSWILWLLSRPIYGAWLLQLLLASRDSQRAEYLADDLAADVAGTQAAISGQEKLLLGGTVAGVIQKHAQARSRTDLFDDMTLAVHQVPDRERERRRRVARLEEARLDDTHPPTALRIELLERRPHREPRVRLTPELSGAIDDELRSRRAVLQRALVEEYRDALYYG